MNTIKTKMGVASVILDVLKCVTKKVTFKEVEIGQYFKHKCDNSEDIYIKIDDLFAIDTNGSWTNFNDEIVIPLNVTIDYDYQLLDENGEEFIPHGRE